MSKPLSWHLIDRAFKMMVSAGYGIRPIDQGNNDPIVAWMTDAQQFLQAVPVEERESRACPYCTSANEAIRSTYYDQTCEGCVKRMGQ